MGRLAGKFVCACTSILAWAASIEAALAQVTIDGTANGQAQSLAGPTFNITSNLGRASGTNLFHSFGTFSIPNGNTANFNGAVAGTTIQNIIARVTGGAQSDINGTVRVDGATLPGANLFLVNPAGIMFGPTATLNVPGSFHVSTADYIGFTNGERFFANPNAAGSTFSVSSPATFGFLGANANPITVNGANLSVANGKTASIVAQDIDIHANGGQAAAITAAQGAVSLLAMGGAGEVGLDGFSAAALGGSIRLSGSSLVDVSGNGAGTVRIRGGTFTSTSSSIFADNTGAANSSGIVSLTANTIELDRTRDPGDAAQSTIRAKTLSSGNGASIVIAATNSLTIKAGARVSATSDSTGNAGQVNVTAQGALLIDGANAPIDAASQLPGATGIVTEANSSGMAGAVSVTAGSLTIREFGSKISSSSNSTGNANSVAVTVAGQLAIDGAAGIFSQTFNATGGNAGSIGVRAGAIVLNNSAQINSGTNGSGVGGNTTIAAGALTLTSGANISATASGTGQAGSVRVDAGAIVIDGAAPTGIFSQSNSTALNAGAAGNIVVVGDDIRLSQQGVISSSTLGGGNAGNVSVTALQNLAITDQGAGVFSVSIISDPQSGRSGTVTVQAGSISLTNGGALSTSSFGGGAAGDVNVTAGQLLVQNGSLISTTAFSTGAAGNVTVKSSGTVTVEGPLPTGIFSQSNAVLGGNAGNVTIEANDLVIRGGAAVSSSTFGTGRAGSVTATIAQNLSIDFGGIFTASFLSDPGTAGNPGALIGGNAGPVDIRAANIGLTNAATINSDTLGAGLAGNVSITAGNLSASGGSSVTATSSGSGNGGSVTVSASNIALSGGSSLSTTSFSSGSAGDISISSGILTMTDANSYVQSQALGSGGAGSILVSADTLTILKDAAITTDTSTSANAGTIQVNVTGVLTIDGTGHTSPSNGAVTGITSDSIGSVGGAGDAGNVVVNAGSLVIRNAAQISSNTNTDGNAGAVTVNVSGTLLIDGSAHPHFGDFTGIASAANEVLDPAQGGRAGNVTVNAGSLTMLTNGQILADTYTDKDAGAINVNAGALAIDGAGQGQITGILSNTFVGDGRAGQITINAGTGFMTNGGKIATETGAAGHGGDIVANFGTLYLQNGASISGTSTDKGNAGNVTVSSPGTIEMMGANTTIQSRATLTGEAGTVLIAADKLIMKEGASVTTEAAVGGGGNITMHLVDLLYMLRSSITTSVAGGSGSGGDIFIDPRFVVLNQSIIQARAFAGNGGNITIIAGRFLQSIDSIIDASSTLGVSGLIATTTPETDVVSGLAQLPTGLGSESKLEQRACVGPDEAPTLSLVPVGRGGLAIVPDASLSQPAFVVAGRGQPARGTAAQPLEASPQLAQFQALAMDLPSSIRCVH